MKRGEGSERQRDDTTLSLSQREPVVDLGVQLETQSFSVTLRGEKPLIRVSWVISDHRFQPEYSDLDHRLSRNEEFRARLSQTHFQIREQGRCTEPTDLRNSEFLRRGEGEETKVKTQRATRVLATSLPSLRLYAHRLSHSDQALS